MPVPAELKPFFTRLVEKSKRGEIHWREAERAETYRVLFPDMAIIVSQDGERRVRVELLNDHGGTAAQISVDYGDEEWLGAVALVNTANRAVTKIDSTIRRAMDELSKDGPIGEDPGDD